MSTRSRHRRTAALVALSLVLGAIVNVAVAWAIGYWVGYPSNAVLEEVRYGDAPEEDRHVVLVTRGLGSELLFGKYDGVHYKDGWSVPDAAIVPPCHDWLSWSQIRSRSFAEYCSAGRSGPYIVGEEACGWPLLSFSWQHHMQPNQGGQMMYGHVYGGLDLGGDEQRIRYVPRSAQELLDELPLDFWARTPGTGTFANERVLPYLPIWKGTFANVTFYALAIWLAAAALRLPRRWWRTSHGRCPACAYPVGTSPICTECGNPVEPNRGPSMPR